MSCKSYCRRCFARESLLPELLAWIDAFDADPRHRLLMRNMDCECRRSDIDEAIWQDFLRDVVAEFEPPDNCRAIDAVLERDRNGRKRYFLPGKAIPPTPRLFRYIRLDHFYRFNTRQPFRPTRIENWKRAAEFINDGRLRMSQGTVGAPGLPCWCTGASLGGADPSQIRDVLGLHCIDGGYLVELNYDSQLLAKQADPVVLHAPTVLDSWAGGAENWVFRKRSDPGGPDWGRTARLTKSGTLSEGAPEAVHPTLTPSPPDLASVQAVALGPIGRSPPGTTYSTAA